MTARTFPAATARALAGAGWVVGQRIARIERFGCKVAVWADGVWELTTPTGILRCGEESHPALAAMECNNISWGFKS